MKMNENEALIIYIDLILHGNNYTLEVKIV